jgi:hypothetical protein
VHEVGFSLHNYIAMQAQQNIKKVTINLTNTPTFRNLYHKHTVK